MGTYIIREVYDFIRKNQRRLEPDAERGLRANLWDLYTTEQPAPYDERETNP